MKLFIKLMISSLLFSLLFNLGVLAKDYQSELSAFRKTFSLPELIDWMELLDSPPANIMTCLNTFKYQEAIWLLEDAKLYEKAEKVKFFLSTIMQFAPIPDEGIKDLGMGGATKPLSISLPYGVRAVFKKHKRHPSSSYRSEISAYLIDQMGKFKLVPMTVFRQINGKKGSLQFFIQNARQAAFNRDYVKSGNLNAFDYIISNRDRNSLNILLASDREIAIDHGLSLRGANIYGHFLNITDQIKDSVKWPVDPLRKVLLHPKRNTERFQVDKEILNNLAALSYNTVKESLGGWLGKRKIKKLYRKIKVILQINR